MTPKYHCVCLLLACAGLSSAFSAEADGLEVYESLDEVTIGRIFLSPQERARLDERRGKAQQAVAGGATKAAPSRKSHPRASGYIVSSSGRTRVWSDGDFDSTGKAPQMIFPGDVKVTHKAASERDGDPEPGAADDGA